MDWANVLKFMLTVCTPIGTAAIVWGIRSAAASLASYVGNAKAQEYILEITGAVVTAVQYTNQAYVDALKETDGFTEAEQQAAFNTALNACKASLSDSAKVFIRQTFGDLEQYLTTLIEAQVRAQKVYL